MSVSAILTSFNAHALVRSMDLGCEIRTVQANAPRFSLECGIMQSFGPETVTCQADESWYFPSVGHKSIRLEQESDQDSDGFDLRGDGITATVSPEDSTAVIHYEGLEYDCK